MKVVRHGNVKGLDEDYKLYIDSFEELDVFHKDLLKKGYLFMYRKGNFPYEEFDKFTILHYMNKQLKLFDFAIMFPETDEKRASYPKSELTIKIDNVYRDAKNKPTVKPRLMLFMKHYTRLMAFVKHMIAYDKQELDGDYKERFNKELQYIKKEIIDIDNDSTNIDNIRKIMKDMFEILLPEYS